MWKNVQINAQNIVKETEKSVLVKLPRIQFCFWHPRKLIRVMKEGNGYFLSLGYTDQFEFKTFRTGKNFKIFEEITLTAKEFEALYEEK